VLNFPPFAIDPRAEVAPSLVVPVRELTPFLIAPLTAEFNHHDIVERTLLVIDSKIMSKYACTLLLKVFIRYVIQRKI